MQKTGNKSDMLVMWSVLKKNRETKSCLAFISLHRFTLAQTWESSSRNLCNEECYHSCSEGHWAIANLSSFLSLQKTKLCGTFESRILMRLLHLNFFSSCQFQIFVTCCDLLRDPFKVGKMGRARAEVLGALPGSLMALLHQQVKQQHRLAFGSCLFPFTPFQRRRCLASAVHVRDATADLWI